MLTGQLNPWRKLLLTLFAFNKAFHFSFISLLWKIWKHQLQISVLLNSELFFYSFIWIIVNPGLSPNFHKVIGRIIHINMSAVRPMARVTLTPNGSYFFQEVNTQRSILARVKKSMFIINLTANLGKIIPSISEWVCPIF